MDYATACATLRTRLETLWNAAHPTISVKWAGENNELPSAPAPFLFGEFTTFDQEAVSFGDGVGANRWRTSARMDVDIFVAVGSGYTTAQAFGDEICGYFRGERFAGDLNCWDARTEEIGDSSDDGNYQVMTAVIRFTFDTID